MFPSNYKHLALWKVYSCYGITVVVLGIGIAAKKTASNQTVMCRMKTLLWRECWLENLWTRRKGFIDVIFTFQQNCIAHFTIKMLQNRVYVFYVDCAGLLIMFEISNRMYGCSRANTQYFHNYKSICRLYFIHFCVVIQQSRREICCFVTCSVNDIDHYSDSVYEMTHMCVCECIEMGGVLQDSPAKR